ncbi:TRAP transporter large permease [Arthrobacter sp. B6]|uniref:TRAP transporter large permease n=1 Tax=Arthrobacter sp. B6 TaxID=1570137 RepID=UPI00082C41ED|nr:TRAP transporter large permease [Arthrobacter sp. B6]
MNTHTQFLPPLAEDGTVRKRFPVWLTVAFVVATAVVVAVMLLGEAPKLMIGVLTIVLLLLLLALTVPIGIAMIAASVVGLAAVSSYKTAGASAGEVAFTGVASWSLSVIPLFIVMGIAMWKGGVTAKAYTAARHWLGWLPGGLAFATNAAGASLASTSGSTMGITFALGKMALPEMLDARYKPTLATASVAMAGTLGQVLPPSIMLVIYAGVAEVPVGPQLLAGLIPGLMLAAGFGLVIVLWASLKPSVAPRSTDPSATWGVRLRSLVGTIPLVLIAFLVVGGIFVGVFTATEAAAFGAVFALIVGWFGLARGNRGFISTLKFVGDIFREAIISMAGLFILMIGALLLTRVIALSGIAQNLTTWLISLDLDRVQFMLVLILVYIVLGMFLESLPMILLTVPLLIAPLQAMDVDLLWFGVFIVIMCEIGMVFPPIGLLTFVVHRIAQDPKVNRGVKVTLGNVFLGIMPFTAISIVVVVILIFLPDIPLFIPSLAAK